MTKEDAIWEILNMRGCITASEKLAEIRCVFDSDDYDLGYLLYCLRGDHSRRKKRLRQLGRRNK